jgi:hypothetical protein
MAGRIEIENAPRDRRTVHQEKDRAWRFTHGRRAQPFSEHVQRNIAFLCPIILTPGAGLAGGLRGRAQSGKDPRADAQPGAFENGPAGQGGVGFAVGFAHDISLTAAVIKR